MLHLAECCKLQWEVANIEYARAVPLARNAMFLLVLTLYQKNLTVHTVFFAGFFFGSMRGARQMQKLTCRGHLLPLSSIYVSAPSPWPGLGLNALTHWMLSPPPPVGCGFYMISLVVVVWDAQPPPLLWAPNEVWIATLVPRAFLLFCPPQTWV